MLKLRIALGLALLVGILTLTNGIMNEARPWTIVYRVIVSIVVFAFAGYGVGFAAESFLRNIHDAATGQDKQTEIIEKAQLTDEELSADSTFNPFTSDNFEQISRPKE